MGFGASLRGLLGQPAPITPKGFRLADMVSRNSRTRSRREGGAGTPIYGGTIDDQDSNTETEGAKWYGDVSKPGISQQMLRDPHVRQAYATRTSPIRAAQWPHRPVSDSPLDLEIADFCDYNFHELNNWDAALQNLLRYMADGFSLIELTDDVGAIPKSRFPNHPGGGQGIVLTGMHPIPAWTVSGFFQSESNPLHLGHIEQYLPGSDVEEAATRVIHADRLVRISLDQEGADFAGLAYFRSIYGPWKVKLLLTILDSMRHERHGVGTPTLTLPTDADDDDYDYAEVLLEDLRAHQKGRIILPDGYTFDWSQSSEGDGTDIAKAIARCEFDIAHIFAVAYMLLGKSGGNGSFALSSTLEGQYKTQVDIDAAIVAAAFNHGSDGWSPIERLVRMNYGPDVGIPTLAARNMPTRDWSKLLPAVTQAVTSGVLTADKPLEDHFRRVLLMPDADPTTARVREAAPAPVDEDEDQDQSEDAQDEETTDVE